MMVKRISTILLVAILCVGAFYFLYQDKAPSFSRSEKKSPSQSTEKKPEQKTEKPTDLQTKETTLSQSANAVQVSFKTFGDKKILNQKNSTSKVNSKELFLPFFSKGGSFDRVIKQDNLILAQSQDRVFFLNAKLSILAEFQIVDTIQDFWTYALDGNALRIHIKTSESIQNNNNKTPHDAKSNNQIFYYLESLTLKPNAQGVYEIQNTSSLEVEGDYQFIDANHLAVLVSDSVVFLDITDLNKPQITHEMAFDNPRQILSYNESLFIVHDTFLTIANAVDKAPLSRIDLGTPFKIISPNSLKDNILTVGYLNESSDNSEKTAIKGLGTIAIGKFNDFKDVKRLIDFSSPVLDVTWINTAQKAFITLSNHAFAYFDVPTLKIDPITIPAESLQSCLLFTYDATRNHCGHQISVVEFQEGQSSPPQPPVAPTLPPLQAQKGLAVAESSTQKTPLEQNNVSSSLKILSEFSLEENITSHWLLGDTLFALERLKDGTDIWHMVTAFTKDNPVTKEFKSDAPHIVTQHLLTPVGLLYQTDTLDCFAILPDGDKPLPLILTSKKILSWQSFQNGDNLYLLASLEGIKKGNTLNFSLALFKFETDNFTLVKEIPYKEQPLFTILDGNQIVVMTKSSLTLLEAIHTTLKDDESVINGQETVITYLNTLESVPLGRLFENRTLIDIKIIPASSKIFALLGDNNKSSLTILDLQDLKTAPKELAFDLSNEQFKGITFTQGGVMALIPTLQGVMALNFADETLTPIAITDHTALTLDVTQGGQILCISQGQEGLQCGTLIPPSL